MGPTRPPIQWDPPALIFNGTHHPPIQWESGYSPWKMRPGLKLAILLHVVQRLRSGTVPPLPNVPSWRAKEHLTCTRNTLERAEKVL
jgi:hypothetical protein